mmetsp:Transcript_58834/g.65811  ORF Transcript_58834/g.65811 Transcript_58834/m.65811 type:complete len:236 (-) Transcript_58834:448-1155(-)
MKVVVIIIIIIIQSFCTYCTFSTGTPLLISSSLTTSCVGAARGDEEIIMIGRPGLLIANARSVIMIDINFLKMENVIHFCMVIIVGIFIVINSLANLAVLVIFVITSMAFSRFIIVIVVIAVRLCMLCIFFTFSTFSTFVPIVINFVVVFSLSILSPFVVVVHIISSHVVFVVTPMTVCGEVIILFVINFVVRLTVGDSLLIITHISATVLRFEVIIVSRGLSEVVIVSCISSIS